MLLSWLLAAADSARQPAATTRCRAIKALGEVVQADDSVLANGAVQAAVERALQVRPPRARVTAAGASSLTPTVSPRLRLHSCLAFTS